MKCELQSWYKHKAVIKFLFHRGIKHIEIFCRLNVVYCDEIMEVSEVRAWACKTNAGPTGPINLLDKLLSGNPKMQ